MLPTTSKIYIIKKIISIFLTGIVIKIMDDFLDQDIDSLYRKGLNIFLVVEHSVMSYTLLLLSFAFILDPVTSLSLFFASFALGMLTNLTVKMPTGLYGYQESLIIVFVGCILFRTNMLSSLLIILTVQLCDDFLDFDRDKVTKKNLAFLMGKTECSLLAITAFLLTLYFDYIKAIFTAISAFSVYIVLYIIEMKLSELGKIKPNLFKGEIQNDL